MHPHAYSHVVRVTAPAIEPLSLAQVKLYLRIEHTDEDNSFLQMIAAAREAAELYLGKSLITQSKRLIIERPSSTLYALPQGPVQSIQTVAVEDDDGVQTTLDSGLYRLHVGRNLLQLDQLPTAHSLIVTYVAGFGDEADDVPSLIRQGILQHVAAMCEARETAAPIPARVVESYQFYREVRL